jgi:predicted O-methyltransferase YrrM
MTVVPLLLRHSYFCSVVALVLVTLVHNPQCSSAFVFRAARQQHLNNNININVNKNNPPLLRQQRMQQPFQPRGRAHLAHTKEQELSDTSSTEAPVTTPVFQVTSSSLGSIRRICLPGDRDGLADGTQFVSTIGVSTFAALNGTDLADYYDADAQEFSVTGTGTGTANATKTATKTARARGLEGVLNQGPAFVLDDVLPAKLCRDWIQLFEQELGFGNYRAGKNHHGAIQLVVSQQTVDSISQRLSRHVNVDQVHERLMEMESIHSHGKNSGVEEGVRSIPTPQDVRLVYAGLNRRWRIYRYAPGGVETFAPHIDAGFPPSGLSEDEMELVWDINPSVDSTWDDISDDGNYSSTANKIVSRLTVLLYLNDDFEGGETKFYQPPAEKRTYDDVDNGEPLPPPSVIASVRPVAGSCLVFPQGVGEAAVDYARKYWPLHEGAPVTSGSPKYVIRSDILFAEQRGPLPLTDKFSKFDHLVRDAFLPSSSSSSVLDAEFASHLSSLYNPHMGVENMGPFLYSFLRLTKKRQIVEIGAGYTSPWLLQALKDNDDEMERIRELQRSGECRLMDWPWTVPEAVEEYDELKSSLLCIDNCKHQKETATGAEAIAKSLGLDSYFQFLQTDAFALELLDESVDVLWCDFGVGSHMKDFVAGAWSSLRPGGFLLCHSTLTNKNTRDWLEAVRSRQGQDVTGIPAGEYVELSLLEPHKHYQNSISILQKRKDYQEPLYSTYA